MSGLHQRPPRSSLVRSLAAVMLVGVCLTGCAGSSSEEPNTAGDASAVPGSLPNINTSADGDIQVSGVAVHRNGNQLTITAKIRNTSTADTLTSISSQVTATKTYSPALAIPADSTTILGGSTNTTVLTVNARLEPGGTVALTFNFAQNGLVDAYSTFTGS